MADTDEFVVGASLPRICAVSARDGLRITVTWESDGPENAAQVVDLAPAIYRYKIYAPLREDEELFRQVHVIDGGFAVSWGDDNLEMASTTIAELASQAMSPAEFAAFVKRHQFTLESVAAELGISRRLAAYYTKERDIPRSIALACRWIDHVRGDVAPAAVRQQA